MVAVDPKHHLNTRCLTRTLIVLQFYVLLELSVALFRCEWCDADEGVEVVSELVEEATEIAFSVVYSHYLEEQAFPHSVNDAKHSLLKIIEVYVLGKCMCDNIICRPSPSNQSFYTCRLIAGYQRGTGDHRVGQ
jgi:hypothetical protein